MWKSNRSWLYKFNKYLTKFKKGTKNKPIHYNKDNKFIGYSDSDFTNNEKTRRSISGYIFLLGKSPISWKSQLQKNVTLSTAEAEFVRLTECTK